MMGGLLLMIAGRGRGGRGGFYFVGGASGLPAGCDAAVVGGQLPVGGKHAAAADAARHGDRVCGGDFLM